MSAKIKLSQSIIVLISLVELYFRLFYLDRIQQYTPRKNVSYKDWELITKTLEKLLGLTTPKHYNVIPTSQECDV